MSGLKLLEALGQQDFLYTFVVNPVKFMVGKMSLVPGSLAVGYDPKSRQSMLVGPPFSANKETATNTLSAEIRMYQKLCAAGEVS